MKPKRHFEVWLKFVRAIEAIDALHPEKKWVLALSGGLDSTVLAHLCSRLASKLSVELFGLHVNHGLRGQEALADAQWCQKYFQQKDKFLFKDIQIVSGKFTLDSGENKQEKARLIRQRRLQDYAHLVGAKAVLLAHHAQDQAETVLMHLVRGSGLKGLGGMAFCRQHAGLIWVRPLLEHTKEELKVYAQEHQLSFREDASNQTSIYLRNRIRQHILPQLLAENPQVLKHISYMAHSLREDSAWLAQATEQALVDVCDWQQKRLDRSWFFLPQGLQRRVLKNFLDFFHVRLDPVQFERTLNWMQKNCGPHRRGCGRHFVLERQESAFVLKSNGVG